MVPEPKFTFRQTIKKVVANKQDASGSASVFIEKLKDTSVEIVVAGARLVAATKVLNDTNTTIPVTNGKLTVSENTPLHLALDNLTKDDVVKITATGKDAAGKETSSKSLEFKVLTASD